MNTPSVPAASALAQLQHALTQPPPHLSDPTNYHYHNSINNNNNNPMAVAHAVLEHLQNMGDPEWLFLRTLLELINNSSIDQHQELAFHCIVGVRQVVLFQWKRHSILFVQCLRDFFMVLGQQQQQQQQQQFINRRPLRLACYSAAVAFWKRGWMDLEQSLSAADDSQQPNAEEQHLLQLLTAHWTVPHLKTKNDLFAHLESLLLLDSSQGGSSSSSSTMSPLNHAITFLHSLVGEISGKSAITYRMPLEFHKQVHRDFETGGALHKCIELSFCGLESICYNRDAPVLLHSSETTATGCLLVADCLSWEFGHAAWDEGAWGVSSGASRAILRPPSEWRALVLQPNVIGALVQLLHAQQPTDDGAAVVVVVVAQAIRQLLLVYASLAGPIFVDNDERLQFAACLLEGASSILQRLSIDATDESSDLLDVLQLIARIVQNYRLSILVQLPSFTTILQVIVQIGTKLLSDQVRDCEQAQGDWDAMIHRDWREEAITLLLDCVVLLPNDPWLLYSGTDESRRIAQQSLSTLLGPLYPEFVRCRTRMAAMEEHSFTRNQINLDEVREEITAVELEDEMSSLASIGRLEVSAAVSCLSAACGRVVPELQSQWEGLGEVTPTTAALLEEARLLTVYICHLLTDKNEGESPAIPETLLIACQDKGQVASEIASAVDALFRFAEAQVTQISQNPFNECLSPLLAKTFLWFFKRWAPAYICAPSYGSAGTENALTKIWSDDKKSQEAVEFCLSVCFRYQCFWPQEHAVQEAAAAFLHALAMRGENLRARMTSSHTLRQMMQIHCLTAGTRHSISDHEFEAHVKAMIGHSPMPHMKLLLGYQKLPYRDKGTILTALLLACSSPSDPVATSLFREALNAVHDAFVSLADGLGSKRIAPDDMNTKEMVALCLEMFCGVVHASEMPESERIASFVTSYLPQLSGLMDFYATNLAICESLLRFFRDYTEQFIALLDPAQSLVLFTAAADVLKSYSFHHCAARRIELRKSKVEADTDEDQEYNDILCAIHLLINLGTKDFIDACSTEDGVDSTKVTDVIFFGLKQIIPLMTQGLLQLPALCSQFFDLVGFMMETYPEKVCSLPYDLFQSLLEALLFGMSNSDASVAKCSLHGLASLAREQNNTRSLAMHLTHHPDIFDQCSRRLLTEVIFKSVVLDRVEAAGMALLPLAAVDLNRFAGVVNEVTHQAPDEAQRNRLQEAFRRLIVTDVIAKASKSGYEGRMNRKNFKDLFQDFVNETLPFVVIK